MDILSQFFPILTKLFCYKGCAIVWNLLFYSINNELLAAIASPSREADHIKTFGQGGNIDVLLPRTNAACINGLSQGIANADKGLAFHRIGEADGVLAAVVEKVEGLVRVFVGVPVAAEVDGPFL